MPVVTRDSVNATYQINLVTSGQIRQISAYLPEDQNALVIITNMRDFKGKPAKGIGFTADMTLKQGAWPGDFAALAGDTGTAHAVQIHLCTKKCKASGTIVHLGEWAFLTTEDIQMLTAGDPRGDQPLLKALHASNAPAAAVPATSDQSPALATRTPPTPLAIDTPKALQKAPPPVIPAELVEWARTAKVPEFAEVLHRCDLHTVAEVAALHDTDIESLFVAENVMPGTRARFRLAITGLRMANGGNVCGSGWFDVEAGRELSLSDLQAAGADVHLNIADGVGFVRLPVRGWCLLRRCGASPAGASTGDPATACAQPALASAQLPMASAQPAGAGGYAAAAPGLMAAPTPPSFAAPAAGPDFGSAGPLMEMAANAQLLLRQLGSEADDVAMGTGAAAPQRFPAPVSAPVPPPQATAYSGARPGVAPAPLQHPPAAHGTRPTAAVQPASATGRLRTDPVMLKQTTPVTLNVTSRQAPAIRAEWTSEGKVRFETAVLNRTWKKAESKAAALAIARGLDVAQDEGLPVDQLGFAECNARELVALWFADKTGDADTADYLRETSMSTWGVPKGLWLEAKEYRKLTGSK